MADSTVQIYGFVNDTALYRKTNDDGANLPFSEIDQGACCASDKVNNMMLDPALIQDPRPNRLSFGNILSFNNTELSDATKGAIQGSVGAGNFSIVVDKSKLDNATWTLLNNNPGMVSLFNLVEVLGYAQNVIDLDDTGTIDSGATIFQDVRVATYKNELNAKNVSIPDPGFVGNVETSLNEFVVGTLKLQIRNYIEFTCTIGSTNFTFHLYWGREYFLENYPLTSFVSAIFPCPKTNLFDLITNYRTLNEFAEFSSDYYITQMNNVVSSGDQTGVYTFPVTYIATPDNVNKNTMRLTFGIVYKGAAPILSDAREYLAGKILEIGHTADEWAEKFPDLFADKRFFIIPFYAKEGALSSDPSVFVSKALYSMSEIETLVRTYLGNPEEHPYLTEVDNYEILKMNVRGVLALVVPDTENPSALKRLSTIYTDLLTETNSGHVDTMSDPTKLFHEQLNNALAHAAQSTTTGEAVPFTVEGTRWVGFNPDGSTYYILTKGSAS